MQGYKGDKGAGVSFTLRELGKLLQTGEEKAQGDLSLEEGEARLFLLMSNCLNKRQRA